ncbi:MAG: hypothetical protein LBF70_01395, partial [Holosporales bacterium]|jgi:ribonuclease J|nr:hypothetical protein [Holosporales bacterium]
LFKLARGENRSIKLNKNDIVFFSSKVIPGNELSIREVQNQLIRDGVEIITKEIESNIHVSGHPNKKALKTIYKWLKPKTFIPIHGDCMMLHIHKLFAEKNGIQETLMVDSGDLVSLSGSTLKKIDHFDVMFNAIDGSTLIPVDSSTIRDREIISCNGHISVSFVLSVERKRTSSLLKNLEIVTNGIYVNKEIYKKINDVVRKTIQNEISKNIKEIKMECSFAIKRLINKLLEKKPIVTIHIHEI